MGVGKQCHNYFLKVLNPLLFFSGYPVLEEAGSLGPPVGRVEERPLARALRRPLVGGGHRGAVVQPAPRRALPDAAAAAFPPVHHFQLATPPGTVSLSYA